MQGRSREMRWIAGIALVVALIVAVVLAGQAGPVVEAQTAQTRTPTETLEPLGTPTATEEVTPLLPMTPTLEVTPTVEVTETPMVTPTEPVTPGLPETGVELDGVGTMVVVGEGRVQASPDIAFANVGVAAEAETVISATQQVSETMDAVLRALVDAGVAEEDIQTTSYNINLIDGFNGPPGEEPETRYRVTNAVQVIIRDIDAVGPTIDAAVQAGANQVFGVNFDVSDRSEFVQEALEEAVQNAEMRAQQLAELTNVQLGPIVGVSQVIGAPGITGVMAEAAVGLGGGPGPISPGQLDVTTQVQLTYALQ